MGIVLAILVFSFIILFHEFGHFIIAKAHGIRVNEFWLGMGPRLLHKEIKGTDFSLRLIPMGGACLMGEDDENSFGEGSFNSKAPWKRFTVIAAGPVFNFILAFVFSLFIVGYAGIDRPVVSSVVEGSPAQAAGIQAGDKIVKIGNKSIHVFREISFYNSTHQGEEYEVTYVRGGEKYKVTLTPEKNEAGYYMMGVTSNGYERANLIETIGYSAYEVKYWIDVTIKSLAMLFTGQVGMNELSGPVGVVSVVNDTYNASKTSGALIVLLNLLNISVLLSANLGVMNLLPLPALDGGRLIFILAEMIRGKRVPPEKEGIVHLIGMAFLVLVMILILFNDIRRII